MPGSALFGCGTCCGPKRRSMPAWRLMRLQHWWTAQPLTSRSAPLAAEAELQKSEPPRPFEAPSPLSVCLRLSQSLFISHHSALWGGGALAYVYLTELLPTYSGTAACGNGHPRPHGRLTGLCPSTRARSKQAACPAHLDRILHQTAIETKGLTLIESSDPHALCHATLLQS